MKRYYFAIHSPKNIPEFNFGRNFIVIQPNKGQAVTFNKIHIDVNNAINCHNYEHDEYLRSDCIAICVLKKIQHKNGHYFAMKSEFLFMNRYKNLLRDFNRTLYKNPDRIEPSSEFKPECMKQCKQDCSFEYYVYDITFGSEKEPNFYYKGSNIHIYHKLIPDIYIKHIPETTFISFISNFGGLLGMWLGISVILIFENIFNLFKQIIGKFSKPKPGNLFIQIIQNQNINFN